MKKIALVLLTGFVFTSVPNTPLVRAKETMPSPVIAKDDTYPIPVTEIVTPDKAVRRGHNVIFGIKPTSDPKPKGLLKSTYIWVISPKVDDLFALPDNTKASFGSGERGDPSLYTLTLVTNHLYVDADGKNPVIITVQADREITIQDGDTPVPDVPDDALPVGKYNLASFTKSLVKAAKLDKSDAGNLAGSFRSMLARHAGSPFSMPADLGNATIVSNKLALADHLTPWQPILTQLAAKTNELKIGRSVEEMLIAWGEIANGLEAYQKAR